MNTNELRQGRQIKLVTWEHLKGTSALCLAFAIASLTGCRPAHPRGPAGQITLSYDGASNTTIRFFLDNRSDHAIFFQASKFFGSDAEPWHSGVVCSQANGEMSIGNFPPLDYDFHPKNIGVVPEERLRLSYPKEALDMSGTCHLEIKLPNGSEIKSDDFNT